MLQKSNVRATWCAVLLVAFGVLLALPANAPAVDFTARGEWIMGFAVGDGNLVRREEGRNTTAEDDRFGAAQRVRLQLDAVASEALSGAVFFEIGTQTWGRDVDDLGNGGAGRGAGNGWRHRQGQARLS